LSLLAIVLPIVAALAALGLIIFIARKTFRILKKKRAGKSASA
jgi:nitrogen fixation/metabolism regulation signal transduction histidine kinase